MKRIIIITGPTASGKSKLAAELAGSLAKERQTVIINCDSMQVYKEIPILTAQPDAAEKQKIPHKLYSIISLEDNFSAGIWLNLAKKEIDAARNSCITPILVGGTGMYIKALMEGIAATPEISDEIKNQAKQKLAEAGNENFHEMLRKIDAAAMQFIKINDRQRMLRVYEVFLATAKPLSYWQQQKPLKFYNPEDFALFAIAPERQKLYETINARFFEMLENGALHEVQQVVDLGLKPTANALKAHGLREIIAFIKGEISKEKMIESVQQQIRNYAKRQMTWIRNQYPQKILVSKHYEIIKNLER